MSTILSKKKSVFITGASSGIGFYLALEFAKRGYQVFAGARRVELMKPLEEHGITTLKVDVSSTESILEAKKTILEKTDGGLDILYNNAGMVHPSPIFDLDKKDIEYVFKVNVFGPLELIKEFQIPLLKSKGTVVFSGSGVQHVPPPFAIAYASSKASMSYVAKILALETGKLGIKVVDVVTGAVEGESWDHLARETPKDSVYYLEDDNILKNYPVESKTPTAVYTKNAVDGVEKAIKKGTQYTQLYTGHGIKLHWFLGTFLPFWLYSIVILKALKMDQTLDKVAKKLKGRF